jgi:hypothetical protein
MHVLSRFGAWNAVLALLLVPAAATAQKGGVEVQFDSIDKVELHGTFYSGGKAKAPCVLLLHKYGGNRQQKGWDELAEALSKEFSVLSFDFRGHGDSTTVNQSFWVGSNATMIKNAAKKPNKISYKDFSANYLPMLANDVAAAKRYLDQQNDAGACNSSNLVIIGAEEGAAIGALWISTEWQRQRLIKNPIGTWVRDPQGKVEGEDIASAIWLSMPQRLNNVDVGVWLKGPSNKVRDKVPMVFFYGAQDTKAQSAATKLLNELKQASSREKLTDLTALRSKPTKLAGVDLLGKKDFKTEDDILVYLTEKALPKRGIKAWVQRDADRPLVQVPLQQQFGLVLPVIR